MLPRATIATVVMLLAPASDYSLAAVAVEPLVLDSPQLMIPLLLAILIVASVGAIVLYTGRFSGQETDAGSTADEPVPVDGPTVGTESPTQTQQRTPEPEQLSDEDRVIRLLEENGGRMKQVNIVENTDWSKSKVSMLLSDMEEEGEISKLRVGRENIISLAGEEPDAAGSPFEE
jgi:uncharacterized membrane protein